MRTSIPSALASTHKAGQVKASSLERKLESLQTKLEGSKAKVEALRATARAKPAPAKIAASAPKASTAKKTVPAKKPAAKAAPKAKARVEPDDLLLIPGIGPKFAKGLKKAGITTFKQIAKLEKKSLEKVAKRLLAELCLRCRPSRPQPRRVR